MTGVRLTSSTGDEHLHWGWLLFGDWTLYRSNVSLVCGGSTHTLGIAIVWGFGHLKGVRLV